MMLEKILVITATVLSLAAVIMKKSWHMFALSALANYMMAASFLVLGGAKSGMGVAVVAGIQATLACFYAIKEREFQTSEKIIFLILYIVCSVLNIKNVYDILPLIASIFCMTAIFQKNTQKVRIFNIWNSVTWIGYDFLVGSTAVYSQLLFLSMNIISIRKYRHSA